MLCNKCGTQLPDDAKFCDKCSAPIPEAAPPEYVTPTVQHAPKAFSNKKNIIIIIVAAIVLIAGAIIAIAIGTSNSGKNSLTAQIELAEKYLSEQNYEQAIIEFQKAIEIEPMNVDAYIGLTDAYLGLGDTEKAIEVLKEGIDKTGDSRLQNKLDELTKPAETTPDITEKPGVAEPEENKPLKASDLSWVLEPTYDFDDIRPIHMGNFSDRGISEHNNVNALHNLFDNAGGAEISFPSYSSLEEYYDVSEGGKHKVFYMPERILSPFFADQCINNVLTGGIYIFPSNDYDYEQYYSKDINEFPWKNKMDLGNRGGGSAWLIWDDYSRKGYVALEWIGTINVKPLYEYFLNKNYPVQKYDLSPLGRAIQEETEINCVDYTDEDWNEYNETVKPLQTPVANKYALWSPENKLLTDFIYDDMLASSYGITAACRNGKWGYLDENGKEITEFIYDAPWLIGTDYNMETGEAIDIYAAYPCTNDTMVVSLNGQLGVLNRDGTTLIDFGEFEDLAPAWNNQLWAKLGGKWGLIDLATAKAHAEALTEQES